MVRLTRRRTLAIAAAAVAAAVAATYAAAWLTRPAYTLRLGYRVGDAFGYSAEAEVTDEYGHAWTESGSYSVEVVGATGDNFTLLIAYPGADNIPGENVEVVLSARGEPLGSGGESWGELESLARALALPEGPVRVGGGWSTPLSATWEVPDFSFDDLYLGTATFALSGSSSGTLAAVETVETPAGRFDCYILETSADVTVTVQFEVVVPGMGGASMRMKNSGRLALDAGRLFPVREEVSSEVASTVGDFGRTTRSRITTVLENVLLA